MRTIAKTQYVPLTSTESLPDAGLVQTVVVQLAKLKRELNAGLVDTTTPEFHEIVANIQRLRRELI
jgi:hypothetical protein